MKSIKVTHFSMAVIAAVVAAGAFNSAQAKQPAKVANPIAVVGKTADAKYNVYDLKGDLSDLNYASSKGILYQPDDLVKRMDFLKEEDANKGTYTCEFICKDKQGHVVGLNPSWKKVYGIK